MEERYDAAGMYMTAGDEQEIHSKSEENIITLGARSGFRCIQ